MAFTPWTSKQLNSALGGIAGEQLTENAKKETIELALDGRSIADISREEANALMRSPDFSDNERY
jgi:hypothetical protein